MLSPSSATPSAVVIHFFMYLQFALSDKRFYCCLSLVVVVKCEIHVWLLDSCMGVPECWVAGVVICLERRCRLTYGLADATATHCLLLQ